MALVLIALGIHIPFLRSATTRTTPEVVASAVAMSARPVTPAAADAVDPAMPLLPPTVLRGAYASGLASGSGPTTAYQLAADLESGGGVAVEWARRAWLALSLLLLAGVTTLSGRLAGDRLSMVVLLTAPLALVIAPLAMGAVVRVDEALVAATLAVGGLLLLVRPGLEPPGPWSSIGGGLLLGMAVSGHGGGVLLVPVPLILAATGPRAGIGARMVIALVATTLGVVVGDPRIAEDPGIFLLRVEAAVTGTPALGHMWVGERLVRGLTPVPVLLGALGLAAVARPPLRGITLALALPVGGGLVLPAAGISTAVLLLPLVALLATLGMRVVAEQVAPRRVPVVAVLVLLAVWPAVLVAGRAAETRKGDSREAAAHWLDHNLPEASRVVTDHYGPAIPPGRVTFLLPFDTTNPRAYAGAYELGWYDGFDTFILVGTQVERYRRDPDTYARQLAFIDRLHAFCVQAAIFPSGEYAGPTVEILVRGAPPGGDRFVELLSAEPPDPPVPGFYVALGRAYHGMGSVETARVLYQVAAQLAPGDPDVAVSLGELYIQEDDLMAADSLLTRAAAASPDDAMVRYQYGRVKQKRKRFGEAIAEYKMAIRRNPVFVEAHYNLAVSYLESGNERGALNSYRKVQELLPSGPLREEADNMVAAITEALGGS